jgi:putative tricarboxylic transport membrane protein
MADSSRYTLVMKNDLYVAIAIIVFSICYLFGANQINQAGSSATVGPRAFPIGIGILMLISGIWLALVTMRKQRAGDSMVELDPVDWRTWVMAVGILLAYALLQPIIGFLIATPLMMFGEAWVFGSRKSKRDAIIAIVLTATAYVVFNYGLGIHI